MEEQYYARENFAYSEHIAPVDHHVLSPLMENSLVLFDNNSSSHFAHYK